MLQNHGAGGEDSWKSLGQQVSPRGNQPWYSLEGLMLKLKLQYFSHLMQGEDSLEKPLRWERLKAQEKGQQRVRSFDSITDSMDVSLSKLRKPREGRGTWCAAVHGVAESQTWLSNWTATKKHPLGKLCTPWGCSGKLKCRLQAEEGKTCGWYHIHLGPEKKVLNSSLCFCLSEHSLFINNGNRISFHFKKVYTSFWQLITLKNM